MKTLTDQQVSDLADYVRGTCLSIEEALAVFDISSDEVDTCLVESVLSADHEIFRCDTCGWWFEIDECETRDALLCLDCANDE